jgi:hypothetical protein
VNILSNIRVKKRYFAFLTVVPLLAVTAIVSVPCPVCDGSGTVNSLPNTDMVSILELDSKQLLGSGVPCGAYIVYKYGIEMQLLNESAENADGWLEIILINSRQEEGSNILDTQYVQINIPPETVVRNEYEVSFGTVMVFQEGLEVRAEVVEGNVPDIICDGTGSISLNTWPLVNGFKDHFVEVVQETQPYNPPDFIDWEEFMSNFFNQ